MSSIEQKRLVLIVDPDAATHRIVGPALEAKGYRVASARTIQEGLAAMVMRPPDAVLLALAMAPYEGRDVLACALDAYAGPVIALASPDEHTRAIAAGAFDLAETPIDIADLLHRLARALANRIGPAKDLMIRLGALEIDAADQSLARHGVAVRLSGREYELLSLLSMSRGRVVTHGQLVDALWGDAHGDGVQHLRVLVANLRQKIETNAASPQIIVTIPGVGYRFVAPADDRLSDATPRTAVRA